jgi:hypothetical protein
MARPSGVARSASILEAQQPPLSPPRRRPGDKEISETSDEFYHQFAIPHAGLDRLLSMIVRSVNCSSVGDRLRSESRPR